MQQHAWVKSLSRMYVVSMNRMSKGYNTRDTDKHDRQTTHNPLAYIVWLPNTILHAALVEVSVSRPTEDNMLHTTAT